MVEEVEDGRQGEQCDSDSNAEGEKRHLEHLLSALTGESSLPDSAVTSVTGIRCRHVK